MFTILVILAAGLICGRLYLRLFGKSVGLAEKMLGYVVWFMLAAFGIRIGSDPGIMGRLPALGLQAFVLGAAATFMSGIALNIFFRRLTPDQTTLTDPRHTSFSGNALKGSALTLLFFAAGLTAGRLSLLPLDTSGSERIATLSLQILIGLVGLSTGSNPRLSSILRGIRPVIIAVPVASIAVTVAAGAVAGWFLTVGAADGSLAVSGMGYYSLSSMIISDLRSEDMGQAAAMSLGAIALMANIVREIIALIVIPLVGPRLGLYGSTAMCGVTSLDVTLPTLVSTFGAEAIPVALVNGIILEISTPFTVMAACTAVAALS